MEIVLQGMAVHVQSTACRQKALPKTSNQCTQLILVGGRPTRFRWTRKAYLKEWVLHKAPGCRVGFNYSVRGISFPDVGLSHGFHGFQYYSTSFRLRAESSESPVISEDQIGDHGEEDKLSEEEWRRKNWIERGWAPWEEILTPEADFARKSLEENEGQALQSPETLEAFMKLTPRMYKKKVLEEGEQREKSEPQASQAKEHTEKAESNGTVWNSPLVFTLIPPRDWPPPGWEVDPEELAFIREAHKLEAVRVDQKDLEAPIDPSEACFPRFRMFIKQYNEWVAANKDRLEKEALEVDQDYYPGRRRTGDDYKEGMYELPFVYPGQIYGGVVTCVHLYQGAFVNIGCVHDGWVPIKGNDWYWIRHYIKVGMHVQVEVLAKRDPYRFRFPIEMRFINPNIDQLIFNRFDYPPIFEREGDRKNLDEISRETGRPFYPRRRLTVKPEDQPLLRDHPYTMEVWQLHVSEQMVLDEEERDPEEKEEDLKEKVEEKELDQDIKEHDSDKVVEGAQWDQGDIEDAQLPKVILTTNIKDLDLDAARAERKAINKLRDEVEAKGKYFVIPKLRRQKQMDELDEMHKRRSIEEREALIRDISCRRELGLPLEEPGRYVDDSFWGKNRYDPQQARCRNDYWGDPWELKKGSKKDREPPSARDEVTSVNDEDLISSEWPSVEAGNMGDDEESKIIGMSKEEIKRNGRKDTSAKNDRSPTSGNKRLVNGTESFSMGDVQGMFDDQGNWNDGEGGEAAASDTENE